MIFIFSIVVVSLFLVGIEFINVVVTGSLVGGIFEEEG